MIYTILSAIGLWFGVHWFYVIMMSAKGRRYELPLYWKVMLFPAALIMVVLDVAFNLTFGVIMFRELPHELQFSGRVQRHVDDSPSDRRRMALWWARILNVFDEHIEL